ncbi:hypothetical protein [Legionella brunensis]|uniref:Uncharacterized protein n=1 Tax=Legionella brunensis TaxID=29422 RepID=A0A0W0S0W9_9GAMM|nr:hypothetical protein [Legionella brunensis]KTC77091.1 hypothetical protein Lbru_3198 [Legionella brunensis]
MNRELLRGEFDDLHDAEIIGIRIYTGNSYKNMNVLLRNKPPAEVCQYGHGMSEVLLDIAMASSGLNKIPTQKIEAVSRANDRSKERMEIINNALLSDKDPCYTEFGFMSTCVNALSTSNVLLNPIGRDITLLSEYPAEREFLISPHTQIKPLVYKKENGGVLIGVPVYTLSSQTKENQLPGLNHVRA